MAIDRMIRRRTVAAVALAMLLTAGCTVGPDFHRPEAPAAGAWTAASVDADIDTTGLGSRPVVKPFDGRLWWSVFQDPVLDRLVDEALRQNIDLQTAVLRIAEARAQRDAAASAELPTVAATGIAGRERMSESGIGSAIGGSSSGGSSGSAGSAPAASSSNLFQLGFDATWELDLWGKTRRNVEAAGAQALSAEQARGDAAVSLTAEIARTYLSLRGLQRQSMIAQLDIADQRRLLALVESSARAGLVPPSDIAQQATQLAAAEARLPTIEQNIGQTTNQVASLLALPPGALRERLGGRPPADAVLPPEVPIGLPGDLLRRRPDVLRSEADLHAATARVGVATSQLFPSIQIGGTAGFQSTNAGDLAQWGSRFFAGGAAVTIPLFQGGRLKAQVKVADLQLQEALLAYRKAVLAAYHDADNALIAYVQEQRHAEALLRQVAQAHRSQDLALARYRSGLSPLSEALQIRLNAHQAELAAVQSTVAASTDLVALYKALGGDWNATAPNE